MFTPRKMTAQPKELSFLRKCNTIKKQSYDPDRQVGVILVSSSGKILATGTNKPPLSTKTSRAQAIDAIANDPNWKYFMLEHAERNAIALAVKRGHSLIGATMYGTLFPCADCARALVTAGVKRIVVPTPGKDKKRDAKWREHYRYAQKIFALAGVSVDFWPETTAMPSLRLDSGG